MGYHVLFYYIITQNTIYFIDLCHKPWTKPSKEKIQYKLLIGNAKMGLRYRKKIKSILFELILVLSLHAIEIIQLTKG